MSFRADVPPDATGPAGAGPVASGESGAARARRLGARAARGTARVTVGTARLTSRVAVGTARRFRRATHAQGAGETGLGRLIELHGLNYAGDALLAVALADTLFFQVPVGQARGRVALYLLLTMAPFALLAPVIGPVLDRVRSGRRWALAGTFGIRAALALVMASAIAGTDDAVRLYPAAFGSLVLSRAYGVTRATVMPRLLPPAIGLVTANGRAQMTGTVGMVVAAVVGSGVAHLFGAPWVLVLCAAAMVLGTVLSLRLPPAVDSAAGEMPARMSARPEPDDRPARWNVGPAVVRGVRANAALRWFSGYLTLFLAFLLREHPLGGLPTAASFGLVVAAAAAGGALGTAAAALLHERRPENTVAVVLGVAAAAAAVGAWLYGTLLVIALVALLAGACQSLGKLSLDAIIQREVPEHVRTSAFARAETVLQLSWVVGGLVGLLLPVGGMVGLVVAAVGLVAGLGLVVWAPPPADVRRVVRRAHHRAEASEPRGPSSQSTYDLTDSGDVPD